MCGITGLVRYDKSVILNSELERMSAVIRHRGPDDAGHECIDNVGLGFRRLSIIDLEGGHQPMASNDSKSWIVFNGEIYNFKQLRVELERKGQRFRTQSDTEVLLCLYEKYGVDCLQHLRGMFGFVIYDSVNKRLFGARDHFGIKPLYYSLGEKGFLFGSEIKSLMQVKDVMKEIDVIALDEYITYGYILGERSIYKSIRKLRPGHYFTLDTVSGEFHTRKYWEPEMLPDLSKSKEEWEEIIRKELRESVELMMNADVPFGAFLSGGIDSSSVVATMAEISKHKVRTFSIGFKEEDFNELKYARILAKRYQTEHYEEIVEPGSVDMISDLVRMYDEPFADSSAIPTYLVSKYARQHVTMVLSGDGGDELFGGYSRYSKMLRLHNRPLNYPVLNKLVFGTLSGLLPDHIPGKGLSFYLSLNSKYIGAQMGIFKPYERSKMYTKDFKHSLNGHLAEDHMIQDFVYQKGDFLTRVQLMEIQNYMTDDVLTKVDRASMAASLEVRVPLLDQKFFEAISHIPSTLKIDGGNLKMIFKSAMKDKLPKEVLLHKKQGFGVPLKHWFKAELKDFISEHLLSEHSKLRKYIKNEAIQSIIVGHQKGGRDFSFKLWSLLFLEEWLRQNESR